MKHNSSNDVNQLALFTIAPVIKSVYDPYWDEISDKVDSLTSKGDGFTTGHQTPESVQESSSQVAHQHSIEIEDTQQADIPCDCVGEQVISDTLNPEKVAHQQEQDIYQTDCVGEQVTTKVAHQQTHWVERYWVERGQKYWYYRYAWMEGRKIRRIYLGSVTHPKAIALKDAINAAIADGQTSSEIIQLIQDSRQGLVRTSGISPTHPKSEQLILAFGNWL